MFPEPVTEFSVAVDLVCDLTVINPFDFFVEESAESFPFTYDEGTRADLAPYLVVPPAGPLLQSWLKKHRPDGMKIIDALVAVNQALCSDIHYRVRMEPGVQPARTR